MLAAVLSLGSTANVVIHLRAFGPNYTFSMYTECNLNNNNNNNNYSVSYIELYAQEQPHGLFLKLSYYVLVAFGLQNHDSTQNLSHFSSGYSIEMTRMNIYFL